MFKEDECMSPQLNCELIVNLCSLLNKQTQHKPSPYVYQAIWVLLKHEEIAPEIRRLVESFVSVRW